MGEGNQGFSNSALRHRRQGSYEEEEVFLLRDSIYTPSISLYTLYILHLNFFLNTKSGCIKRLIGCK